MKSIGGENFAPALGAGPKILPLRSGSELYLCYCPIAPAPCPMPPRRIPADRILE